MIYLNSKGNKPCNNGNRYSLKSFCTPREVKILNSSCYWFKIVLYSEICLLNSPYYTCKLLGTSRLPWANHSRDNNHVPKVSLRS